ncbi:unnamed protein product [Tuber aestivum]|uniref:C3H1-type domain-containing protein n=1 Tax=Tuber aestivum TaxID=59557 RepID=A0A292Q845_9PEZI|nr:unnamed protein product [Tuber aestivum]
MEQQVPSFGIPCPSLKVGQCPDGDGCEYAHDFIPQPCLSAAQIDHQMRGLEDAAPADRAERTYIKRSKARLRRLGARKLVTSSLLERGIAPTKKSIKHELGRYTVGPPNSIAFPATRERDFVGGGEGGGRKRQTAEWARDRRERKRYLRTKRKGVEIHGMSRRSSANRKALAKEDKGVSEGAPGINSPSVEVFFENTTIRGSMDVDEEEVEISRRVETIGDFTVKYPVSVPLHLRDRDSNPLQATVNSPPAQTQQPYTDEGIVYAPSGEIVLEIVKEHVTMRDRALSF